MFLLIDGYLIVFLSVLIVRVFMILLLGVKEIDFIIICVYYFTYASNLTLLTNIFKQLSTKCELHKTLYKIYIVYIQRAHSNQYQYLLMILIFSHISIDNE